MQEHIVLLAASISFVGSHFALSHPLRASLVSRLGDGGFALVYSVVAFATLGWMVSAYRAIERTAGIWVPGDLIWGFATLAMWIAAVLFAGSFIGNPALPAPGARKAASRGPFGVFKITRHPMMWSFAIWGVVHIILAPRWDNVILCGAVITLALVGARLQDDKKFVAMGDIWYQWQSRTAFIPFTRGIAFPGWLALTIGTAIWLFASWAHIAAKLANAGIFRWL